MTQHDAAAAPMVNSFMAKADLSTFTAIPAQIDLLSKNPAQGYGASESARMDFREYDRVDEDALNRILWHSIKGENASSPSPCGGHCRRRWSCSSSAKKRSNAL